MKIIKAQLERERKLEEEGGEKEREKWQGEERDQRPRASIREIGPDEDIEEIFVDEERRNAIDDTPFTYDSIRAVEFGDMRNLSDLQALMYGERNAASISFFMGVAKTNLFRTDALNPIGKSSIWDFGGED